MVHPLLLLAVFWALPSCRTRSDTELFPFRVGKTILYMERTRYIGASPLFIVHIHDNEVTARLAAGAVLDSTGGSLLSLRNEENRLISFLHKGYMYKADPNRIFTAEGRKASLEKWSRYSKPAGNELAAFAQFFLQQVPDSGLVISMHNNTPDAYSIRSYADGGELAAEATNVHINSELDPDDFFITTSPGIFAALSEKNRNVVLQDNTNAVDDGSLSVYFGLQNRSYVNIEAEHGHLEVQMEMLRILSLILEETSFKIESK